MVIFILSLLHYNHNRLVCPFPQSVVPPAIAGSLAWRVRALAAMSPGWCDCPGSRQKGGQGLWPVDSHDWVGLSTSSPSLRIERHLDPDSIPKRMLGHGLRTFDPHKRGGTWGDQGLLATKATPQSRAGLEPEWMVLCPPGWLLVPVPCH